MFYLCFFFIYLLVSKTIPCQMMFVSFNSSTTGFTSGAGTTNPSGAHEFTTVFSGFCVSRPLVFCVVFCLSLFVLLSFFLLVIVLSVLWFTSSDYLFGIFKLFLSQSLVFCVVFYRSLFVLFLLVIVLSVLWFTSSDYLFGISKYSSVCICTYNELQIMN